MPITFKQFLLGEDIVPSSSPTMTAEQVKLAQINAQISQLKVQQGNVKQNSPQNTSFATRLAALTKQAAQLTMVIQRQQAQQQPQQNQQTNQQNSQTMGQQSLNM